MGLILKNKLMNAVFAAWNDLLENEGVETQSVKQEINSTLFLCLKTNTMATHEAPHIGNLIKEELKRQGRTTTWLASQLNYSRQHMYYLLGHSFIYSDLLLRISEILGHDFFAYYSEYLANRKLS